MTEINLFNRWTVKKRTFWLVIGLGIPLLCVVVFGIFALVGIPLGGAGYSATFDEGAEEFFGAPAMEPAADTAFYGEMEGQVGAGEKSTIASDLDNISDETIASSTSPVVTERLIIKEGNISLSVESTRDTRDQIEAIVEDFAAQGAYVVSSSEEGRGEDRQPYINMMIRVPVDQFNSILDQIAEMGVEVLFRNDDAQDVTEEYVDLEGRIDAMEVSIQRLKELMADADFTEDLLNAEEQLSRREAELEALRGRLNYLAQSAALSRINISLTPYELSEPIDARWKPAETFRRAVEDLLFSMQDFADFMIVFGVAVLPWVVFFGLIIWGVVALVRRRRRRKKAREAGEAG